jgi:hypothetical protein
MKTNEHWLGEAWARKKQGGKNHKLNEQ